jgi:hypothetical protein
MPLFLEASALPSSAFIQSVLDGAGVQKPGSRVEYPIPTDFVANLAALVSPLPLRFASILVAEPVLPGNASHTRWHADDDSDPSALRAIIYLTSVFSEDAGALELPTGVVLGSAGTVRGLVDCPPSLLRAERWFKNRPQLAGFAYRLT